MQRNVLIFALLSLAVLLAFQLMFPAPPSPTPRTVPAAPVTAAPPPQQGQQGAAPVATPEAPLPTSEPAAPARDVVVENAAIRGVFTTRGAVLKSWQLKKYHDNAGHPLELIPQKVPADTARPFQLTSDDPAVSKALASAVFNSSAVSLTVGSDPSSLEFDYRDAGDPGGLQAHKKFTFDPAKPYIVVLTATITRGGQQLPTTVEWGPALGSGIIPHGRSYETPPQAIFFKDGSVSRLAQNKVDQYPVHEGMFGFAGVDDHYFLAALAQPTQALRLQYHSMNVPVEGATDPARFVGWSARFQGAVQDESYFVGPKDFDVLAAINRDFVRAIEFGFWAWLVVPLLRALKWVNFYVGNYGWSLILLTILINLAMFPLRHKSVVSMRKMQEIQPEMKAIQDRYKNLKATDPARSKMNTELMNLYRERGVNPASGCIPMLLTMPVLFAFYRMLTVAIELRGAPFAFWIHDLVAPDPYFVLPILMGASMFIQQKMTPTTADPTQARMMMIMPVVLTGMSLFWSSGLLLYWTVSNIWGIGQQMITNRLIGPAPQRTVRPPAERRMKRAGGGKSNPAKERE